MHRSWLTIVIALAACAGRAAPPSAPSPAPEPPAVEATTAPVATTPTPPVTPPTPAAPADVPPPAATEDPDPAAVDQALARATLKVHAAKKHDGVWPAELDAERGPAVFLVDVDVELASFAYRIDPDRLLLETTAGDIVSQSPVTLGVDNGRMTAMFVVGNALQAKSVVVTYDGKRSQPFKLPRR